MWVLLLFLVLTTSAERVARFNTRENVTQEALDDLVDFFAKFQSIGKKDFDRAISLSDISFSCLQHLQYFGQNLNKGWAINMLDSQAKIPFGVLEGNFINFGHYEECVAVDEPGGRFSGQHCMVDFKLTLGKVGFPLFHGLCIPSTCLASDLEAIVSWWAKNASLPATVKVEPENCHVRGLLEPSPGDWAVVGVFFGFVLIGIVSTWYDVYQRFTLKNDKPHQLWSAFSFYTNGKFLLSTTKDPAMMTSLFGIRTITMGWVVLGHAYLNMVYSPVINIVDVPVMNKDHTKVIIFNSFVSVDTFFLLSGMLVCFVFFRSIGKSRSFDQPMGYIHRFLRLTPPYAAVILFEATVFNFLGNGPMWHRIHSQASQNCKDYWWSSILYVQNYVNPLQLCLTQSWYLSADMQMYWVSPLVLYPMFLFPALAVPYLGFLILAISFMDFAFVYTYDLPANFVMNPSDDRMRFDYYPFHTRMAPWLIGVALGYLICGIRAKKIRVNLSPMMITIGWILSTVLMTASFQSMDYFNQTPDYTALESAFFLAFHRVGWALGLSWIIFASVNGFGGVVNNILSWTLFQPLAKLSYCAYLLHISVQRFRIGWLRTNVHLADVDTVWLFLGDFVASNLVAVIFFLLFEQPFTHIDRFIFTGKTVFPWPRPRPATITPKTVEEQPQAEQKQIEEEEEEEERKHE